MDRKFNEFNKFNRDSNRAPSRRRPDDVSRDKFRDMVEDVRMRSRAGSDDFRSNFRDNIMGMRENAQKGKADEKLRGEKAGDRDDSDKEGFIEEFHERQVDYHKDVRKKKNDEESCEGDEFRGSGFGKN